MERGARGAASGAGPAAALGGSAAHARQRLTPAGPGFAGRSRAAENPPRTNLLFPAAGTAEAPGLVTPRAAALAAAQGASQGRPSWHLSAQDHRHPIHRQTSCGNHPGPRAHPETSASDSRLGLQACLIARHRTRHVRCARVCWGLCFEPRPRQEAQRPIPVHVCWAVLQPQQRRVAGCGARATAPGSNSLLSPRDPGSAER